MNYKLYCGDCYDILNKQIPDKSIDLVIIDPPYEQSHSSGAGAFGGTNRKYYGEINPISNGISNSILDILCNKLKRINIYIAIRSNYCNI